MRGKKWCFDCEAPYRGSFVMHQGTRRHRFKVAPRKRSARAAPAWAYGSRHDPPEEYEREWEAVLDSNVTR